MTTPPPGMYPPPQQPLYAQQLLPGWENRAQGHGVSLGDAFDFSFERYATPAVVKVVYVLAVVLCVVAYAGATIVAFALFLPAKDFGGGFRVQGTAFPGIATLLLGWIPALLGILGVRLGLEGALATVRTAIDARALRTHYVGRATE